MFLKKVFLRAEEYKHDRQRDHHTCGHQDWPIARIELLQCSQTEGQGHVCGRLDVEQRFDEIAPVVNKGEDGDGCHRWSGEWQTNAQPDCGTPPRRRVELLRRFRRARD